MLVSLFYYAHFGFSDLGAVIRVKGVRKECSTEAPKARYLCGCVTELKSQLGGNGVRVTSYRCNLRWLECELLTEVLSIQAHSSTHPIPG